MFAIEKGTQMINDRTFDTYSRTVTEPGTVLEVKAGTTGYKGTPCRKAGGRTYLRIKAMSGDFCFEPVFNENGNVAGFEVAACGDAGLNAIMKALEFAQETLNDQRCDVDD